MLLVCLASLDLTVPVSYFYGSWAVATLEAKQIRSSRYPAQIY
jgi:hypothetical protein